LHLNRNFPQQWTGNKYSTYDSVFGIRLLIPVDQYQKSMRSAKYAILFIALTFVVFFFIETLNVKRIHPIQYVLVGLALSVFYVLLLSISEHLGFDTSFVLSALAVTSLISLYAFSMFKNKRLASLMGLLLVIMYGFIYTVLQLEDYALLMGSIGLFIVLAIVMYLSRKIDWYAYSGTGE
jgi:inner membrane protein